MMCNDHQSFEKIPDAIKDLSEAFSKQSRYSNQLWVAVLTASAIIIFPNFKDDVIELPFSIGRVDKATFAPIGFLILTALILAYCQAYALAHTVARFSHRLLDQSKITYGRQLYDFSVIATFARVAPLVDLLNMQLGPTPKGKYLRTIYYATLKIVANVVMLGIPILALLTAYIRVLERVPVTMTPGYVIVAALSSLAFLLATIALFQICFAELEWLSKVGKIYSQPEQRDS